MAKVPMNMDVPPSADRCRAITLSPCYTLAKHGDENKLAETLWVDPQVPHADLQYCSLYILTGTKLK